MAEMDGKVTVETVGKTLIIKINCEESLMSITREKLARALCKYAEMFNYDHGPNPTIDWNIGACPRHTGMAHELIESMWKEEIIGK